MIENLRYWLELGKVATERDMISTPVCDFAEYYYLMWLASETTPLPKIDLLAKHGEYDNYSETPVIAIRKKYNNTKMTSLVVKCAEFPILEGMVLSDDKMDRAIRPFCTYARYDLRSKYRKYQHKKLLETQISKIGLELPRDGESLTTLLSQLLILRGVDEGGHFSNNLIKYGKMMRFIGKVDKNWYQK